ncbi:hypothetical protein BJF78_21905 [Pseudonocardia sp. CNS-139]|nr:hypothetical protein BJF78_21905 [Pseudonocardia sp. CNS-139]
MQDTLREMWETRPARPRDDRQIAGVASAIARRYDIDPVLVRVGFVVAAFSGIGAALYIAGWILLPEEQAVPGAPARRRGPQFFVLAGLGVAAAITIGSIFGGDNGPGFVLPLIAVAVLLFLLHRSRGGRTGQPPQTAAAPQAGTTAAAATAPTTPARRRPARRRRCRPRPRPPPAWDPLGARRSPGTCRSRRPRRRPRRRGARPSPR